MTWISSHSRIVSVLLDNLLGSREVTAVLTAGLLLRLNDSDGIGHLTEAVKSLANVTSLIT